MIPFFRSFYVSLFRLGDNTGPIFTSGTGSPEGVVAAPVGSHYSRTDGGTNTASYRKESGTGNTGWVANSASISATEVTLDFGTTPRQSKTFTFTHTGATVGQKVMLTPSGDMPAGVDRDELEMEPITAYAAVTATNVITVLAAVTAPGGYITGQRKFDYMVL